MGEKKGNGDEAMKMIIRKRVERMDQKSQRKKGGTI